MSKATEIANALAAPNGIIRARGAGIVQSDSTHAPTDMATRLDPLCWYATYTCNGNEIVFAAVPRATANADCVIIGNGTGVAAVGYLSNKGILFSDYFSGCLFFLFRDSQGGLFGVHSYRAGGTFPDPRPYFNRVGARLIYFFNSGNQFAHGNFGAVICHAKTTDIIVDFFEFSGNGNVVRPVDHTVINNWQAHPGIADPNVGGAMAPYDPDTDPASAAAQKRYIKPVAVAPTNANASPKKKGLRHRVAKYFLSYC